MEIGRSVVRAGLFGLVLVANPAYVTACSADDDDPFTYGEAEMLGLLDQVNATESWTFEGYALSLDLEQRAGEATARSEGFVRSAYACSSRTFVKSAAACIDSSSMPVEGTAIVVALLDDGAAEPVATLPVSGSLDVMSLNLDSALLFLYFEGGSVEMRWRKGGDFELVTSAADGLGPDGEPVHS